jgi:hypothetical protein
MEEISPFENWITCGYAKVDHLIHIFFIRTFLIVSLLYAITQFSWVFMMAFKWLEMGK